MRAWCAHSTEPGSNPASRRRLLLAVSVLLLGRRSLAAPAQDLTPPMLDVNRADRAELESLPGLGPGLVSQLLMQRQQAPFADWRDLARRVRGMGPHLQRRLSDAGLRVQGQALEGSAAALASERRDEPASKAAAATATTPVPNMAARGPTLPTRPPAKPQAPPQTRSIGPGAATNRLSASSAPRP